MGIGHSAKDACWSLRRKAWDVDDRLRERVLDASERAEEIAWEAEQRVLWPSGDAARAAAERAMVSVEPLHRLIETKLAWPAADAWRQGGTAMRTGLATAAVAAVAAAGSAGTMVAAPDGGTEAVSAASGGHSPPALTADAASQPTLSGAAPDFDSGASAKKVASRAAQPEESSPITVPGPSAPPAKVARSFAEAFVRYEVGKVDEQTAATFSSVAKEPLAAALEQEPPRLPSGTEVPEAEVLNVVVGDREEDLIEASVSLLRLRAASELRLTLKHTPEGWRVTEVRG